MYIQYSMSRGDVLDGQVSLVRFRYSHVNVNVDVTMAFRSRPRSDPKRRFRFL